MRADSSLTVRALTAPERRSSAGPAFPSGEGLPGNVCADFFNDGGAALPPGRPEVVSSALLAVPMAG